MKLMNADEFGSTGAWLMSRFHQFDPGKSSRPLSGSLRITNDTGPGVGVGDGVGVGVGVGDGVGLGEGVGSGVDVGAGDGAGVDVGDGLVGVLPELPSRWHATAPPTTITKKTPANRINWKDTCRGAGQIPRQL